MSIGIETTLRNIVDPTLTVEQSRLVVSQQYAVLIQSAVKERSVTPHASKNIVEVLKLIQDAIQDYERRTDVIADNRVNITYENPTDPFKFDTVSLTIEKRQPGLFQQGAPFKGDTHQYRPILREEMDDINNPGYKKAILGYWHDNVIRITPWCLSSQSANTRMLWLEEVIEQYIWYFRISGVNRFLYHGHGPQLEKTVNNGRLYGRPIDYFVRTETLRELSEKTLEVIYLNLAFRIDENL